MSGETHAAPVTILFTALVNATRLLQRAGDERAQRIFQAHHALLREAVAANGGHEVKWLGDGLMVAFPSAAAAVRCAVAMQQAAQRPTAGEQLQIKVGLNTGEPLRDERDYFGTPVVVAKRLCDLAQANQILGTRVVAGLLSGRRAFTFRDCGELELKGIAAPVAACEVIYEIDEQPAPVSQAAPTQDEPPPTGLAPVTILYTDLVDSTELLQRAGDERAQRIFRAHHKALQDAVAANGGQEVKWLGDGLMVAFPSATAAVRCAIAMQQTARRPVKGERLQIRVGLNAGEPLRDEKDYFGTPVVVANGLCNLAKSRQILASSLVAELLSGRQAFTFRDCGEVEIKGIDAPLPACELVYDIDEPTALLSHPPFVGRATELEALEQMLQSTIGGDGGLVTLVGEPGIGKTRMAEEFADLARSSGATVLWGRSYEGEWQPPYGPFAEAIEEFSRGADGEALRDDLGNGAGPIARLAPTIATRFPDVPEPPGLRPDEERFRLLDAVSQFFIALANRAPLLLVLDDLHWADGGTIAMLRHLARFASQHRILLLGLYRDVELDRQHPLGDALTAFRREAKYERIQLRGLDAPEISNLLSTISEHDAPESLVAAISAETNGNPFFVREVLLHLAETSAIFQGEGGNGLRIEEIGIPESVRQVIGRRLSRLSDDANRLLTSGSAFSSAFRFGIVATVADLEELPGLDAIDEALAAQLLSPAAKADTYEFSHALIRHTLYAELSPSRQVRLHRRIAETMEDAPDERGTDHTAELAYQYHRSAALPGAERGAPYALVAADRAEAAYAHDDVATFLRMALELLPDDDPQRPALLGRVGMALAWTLDIEAALKAAKDAGELIATMQGRDSAADYLAQAARTMALAGFMREAWDLAGKGLEYAGDGSDITRVWLMGIDLLRREAEDPDNPGMPLDNPERQELAEIVQRLPESERPQAFMYYRSRADILARAGDEPTFLTYYAGEYQRSIALWQEHAVLHEQRGQIANALSDWAQVARCHNALGDFAAASDALKRATAFAARLAGPSPQALQIVSARLDLRTTLEPDSSQYLEETTPLLQQPAAEHAWAHAVIRAVAALAYARQDNVDESLRWLSTTIVTLERAPGWALNYPLLACLCASALWTLERTDHIEVIERNLRLKVIGPDFRFPMQDGRLSMAHLCALQGRHEEASDWFAQARSVLDEQGARPLRAITDLGEAEMYFRRSAPGDDERAKPLLDAALQQFRTLAMTGWLRLAERTDVSE